MSSESDSSIMTVGELIDNAFGEPEVNVVHHKLLQSILYLLARQLRVLERRVAVNIPSGLTYRTSSTLSVTEVKLQAKTKKKIHKPRNDSPSKYKLRTDTAVSGKTTTDKTSSSRTPADKVRSGKTTTDKTSPSRTTTDKIRSANVNSDLTSPEREKSDKVSSDETISDKTYVEKTSSDKTSKNKTSSDKTFKDKTVSDKTSRDETKADKTTTERKSFDTTSEEKISPDKPSTDKKSTDKPSTGQTTSDIDSVKKSSLDKPSGKTSKDKTSSDKDSKDRTSSDDESDEKSTLDRDSDIKSSPDKPLKDKKSSDKVSKDKISSEKPFKGESSSEKSVKDKTLPYETSADKTSPEKPSIDKTLSDKTSKGETLSDKTSTNKKRSDKTSTKTKTSDLIYESSMNETSTEQSASDKKSTLGKRGASSSDTRSRAIQDYRKHLEALEEMRERELRVIRQRVDSREEHDKTPTPIASLDSVEATYEKLLVVERISSEEAAIRAKARGKAGTRSESTSAPRISVVTQEQFDDLAYVVRQIEKKLGPVSAPGFPENAQLMQELRKGASLTDAMAALQLSARLEATEKTLKNMLSLVTDMVKQTPRIDLTDTDDVEVLFGAPSAGKGPRTKQVKATIQAQSGPPGLPSPAKLQGFASDMQSQSETSMDLGATHVVTGSDGVAKEVLKDQVTHEELESALKEINEQILKTVNTSIARNAANADLALKLSTKLEGKIQASLKLASKMDNLETLVSNYAEQINVLDTGLSSQMTYYQEELTQIQHDLEVGLENMAEMMVNTGGDATAVAELNAHFNDLQADIDNTASKQKELKEFQHNLSVDLYSLRRQIEVLREAKSDREEVVDALRDKAGLGALNGLVSLQQFDAVQGDFEKRIGAAYDKFNNQEMVWQRAIDDLLRDLNEKADICQVEGLREDINRHLENMRVKINFIIDIVGEPSAAALSKKLSRDTACLSCAAPAQMRPEEPGGVLLPSLRPPTVGAEAQKPKGDGDHGVCYPGFPISHPRDPRSHVCNRWCGGSHTMLTTPINRAPPGMIITSPNMNVNMEVGPDGKMYAVEKQQTLNPCWQCNNILPPSPETEKKQSDEVTPYHLCPHFNTIDEDFDSTTPAY